MKKFIYTFMLFLVILFSTISASAYNIVEEEIIIGKGTKYELRGTLTLPMSIDTPLPSVVLVHGSGPQDRDETINDNKPFKDIADYLAKRGIAVLRYDKRTYVHAQKLRTEFGSSFTVKEETIDDAVLAANLLKADSRMNPDKVFIAGHSMGGALAPRIDAEGGNFAGIVILAGSPRAFWEISYSQNMHSIDIYKDQMTEEEMEATLKLINDELIKAQNIENIPDEEVKKITVFGLPGYYQKDFVIHPVENYLVNLAKPILIMQGEKDFQVFTDIDYIKYQELLEGKSNYAFKLYPNLNHLFMQSTAKSIFEALEEYKVKSNIDTNVLNDIADWILSNTYYTTSTAVKSDEKITVTIDTNTVITNETILVGIYSSSNKLLDCAIAKNTDIPESFEAIFSDNPDAGNVKVFVLSDLDSIKPLSVMETFEIE